MDDITRVPAPRWMGWTETQDLRRRGAEEACGEQLEWGFALPMLYRRLASPHSFEPFVEAPRPGQDHDEGPAAYWTALAHLIIYSFAWLQPHEGLDRLLADPVLGDPRTELIEEIWGADGMLHWFAAYLHASPCAPRGYRSPLATFAQTPPNDDDDHLVPPWIDEVLDETDRSETVAPMNRGGGDMLHISDHISGPVEVPRAEADLVLDRHRPRAVLTCDSGFGWYRTLTEAGATLPDDWPAWHLEVYCRPLGYLGNYRCSEETGLWYAGPHELHSLGN